MKLSTERTSNEKLTEREQVVTITFAEVPIAGFPNAEKKASLVRFFITDRTHKLDSKNLANILNILGATKIEQIGINKRKSETENSDRDGSIWRRMVPSPDPSYFSTIKYLNRLIVNSFPSFLEHHITNKSSAW